MIDQKAQQEITWIKQMAEEGRNGPLLGGSISIWWGGLGFVMLLIHWATLAEYMPWPIGYIGIGWFLFAVIGVIGTVILGKRLQNTPGVSAISNQVSSAAWTMVMFGIFSFVAGCVFAVVFGGAPPWVFNGILPVAFICYGIAYGVTAKLTKNRSCFLASMASFLLAPVLMALLLSNTVYLLAAFGVLLVMVLPNTGPNKAG